MNISEEGISEEDEEEKISAPIIINPKGVAIQYDIGKSMSVKDDGLLSKKKQRVELWSKILSLIQNGNHITAMKISHKLTEKSKVILEQFKSETPLALKNLYYVICDCLMHVKCKLLCDEIENVWQLLILAKDLLTSHFKFNPREIQDSVRQIKAKKKEIAKMRAQNPEQANYQQIQLQERFFGNVKASFYDFQWVLSALSVIAGFFNEIGDQVQCEQLYVLYASFIERYYGHDSLEAANVYFLMGLYYIEQEFYGKANQCFKKAQLNREKKFGPLDPNVADCRYNIAIVFKKRGLLDKGIEEMTRALEARRGKNALSAAKALEELGKMYLEKGDYTAAFEKLQECYDIRKKLIRDMQHPQLNRVCYLVLFLHRLIEKQVSSQSKNPSIVLQKNLKLSKMLSSKLMQSNNSSIVQRAFQTKGERFGESFSNSSTDAQKLKRLFNTESQVDQGDYTQSQGMQEVGSIGMVQPITLPFEEEKDFFNTQAPPQSYNNTGPQDFRDLMEEGGGGFLGADQIQHTQGIEQFLKLIEDVEEIEVPQEDPIDPQLTQLVGFFQTLSRNQIDQLVRQSDKNYLYFSEQFVAQLNALQQGLLSESQILFKATKDYCKGPLTLKNLKIPKKFGLSKHQEETMLNMFQAKNQVYTVLTSSQKEIFHSCMENNISLWTLINSLTIRQRDVFRRSLQRYVTQNLQEDITLPHYSHLLNLIEQPGVPEYNSIDRSKLSYKHTFISLYWRYVETGLQAFKQQFSPSLPPMQQSTLSGQKIAKIAEIKRSIVPSLQAQDLFLLLNELLFLFSEQQIYWLLVKNLFLFDPVPQYLSNSQNVVQNVSAMPQTSMDEPIIPEAILEDEKILGQMSLSASELNLIKDNPQILNNFLQK